MSAQYNIGSLVWFAGSIREVQGVSEEAPWRYMLDGNPSAVDEVAIAGRVTASQVRDTSWALVKAEEAATSHSKAIASLVLAALQTQEVQEALAKLIDSKVDDKFEEFTEGSEFDNAVREVVGNIDFEVSARVRY